MASRANALCHGTCLQDIDRPRYDAFLGALAARRTPDPTTAGDFCRHFSGESLDTLQEAVTVARRTVWAKQPASYVDRATLDMSGRLVAAPGACQTGLVWTPASRAVRWWRASDPPVAGMHGGVLADGWWLATDAVRPAGDEPTSGRAPS